MVESSPSEAVASRDLEIVASPLIPFPIPTVRGPLFHRRGDTYFPKLRFEPEVPAQFFLRDLLERPIASVADIDAFVTDFGFVCLAAPTAGALLHRDDVKALQAIKRHEPFSVEEARLSLSLLRATAKHFVALQLNDHTRAAWKEEGFAVSNERTALRVWSLVMNEQLSPIGPRFQIQGLRRRLGAEARPTIDIATCVALQIFNTLAENRIVHRCANETCRRPFTEKEGSSTTGRTWSTTGVRYCSEKCKNAQKQRDRRQRLKDEPAPRIGPPPG